MAGVGDIVTQLGGAVGSLFTSQGNAAEAASYTGAAQLETQNAQLTAASTRIQATQTARAVTQSLGTTQADVAGAGFTNSGSALDLLRSSAQQGSLATSLVNIQGAINENAYAAEAGADLAKAKAANEANTASTIQSIASLGGALINNEGSLASAGKTVFSTGANFISDPLATLNGIGGTGTFVNAAGDSVAAGTPGAVEVANSTLSTGSAGLADFASEDFAASGGGLGASTLSATDAAISSTATLDTSGVALGTSDAAATAGISDFFAGAADTIGAGIADAGAAAAAAAAGVSDAVAGAASFLGDAAIAACA